MNSKLKINSIIIISVLSVFFACNKSNGIKTTKNLEIVNHLRKQLLYSNESVSHALLNNNNKELVGPRSVCNDSIKLIPSRDWCSGFYPGIFWQMAKLTDDTSWQKLAEKYTAPLEQEKYNGKTHDMGFKMYCSFGNGYLQTSNPQYREILIQAANTLIKRFNKNVGCIRSWDFNSDKWEFPVIIDNMMNLELLFWASKETGNPIYYNIAVSHAETTLKNHFRKDNSSCHVVDYIPETGEVNAKYTHQGFSDESSWSRGQAWGLYGFTMVYRETRDVKFLRQAEKIATYILDNPNLPKNKIPYWDFDAPGIPEEPYDASAAAILASALYELSEYSSESSKYLKTADEILESLSSPEFLADSESNNGFLLKHSTGSKPHNSEVDVPLIYADYYFIEALTRKFNYQN
ncbi:MAG: glycoside hydrolase family 88 protein [Bacteroidales bacterium]